MNEGPKGETEMGRRDERVSRERQKRKIKQRKERNIQSLDLGNTDQSGSPLDLAHFV